METVFPKIPKVYAEVMKGDDPIIEATVVMRVEPENSPSFSVNLLDTGSGADITRDDGIYTAFVTQISGNGRYSLSTEVVNDGKARVKKSDRKQFSGSETIPTIDTKTLGTPKSTFTSGDFNPVPDPLPEEKVQLEPVYNFQRQQNTGSFRVTQYQKNRDVIPPSPVRDLEVMSANKSRRVELQWTASGDDMTEGKASVIDIKVGTNPDDLVDDYDNQLDIDLTNATTPGGDPFILVEGGQVQNLVLEVPEEVWNETDTGFQLYFSLKSQDKAGNKGFMSNLAIADFPPKLTGNGSTLPLVSSSLSILSLLLVFVVSSFCKL
jgi:calcium-activated chloride channel regulator 4